MKKPNVAFVTLSNRRPDETQMSGIQIIGEVAFDAACAAGKDYRDANKIADRAKLAEKSDQDRMRLCALSAQSPDAHMRRSLRDFLASA